MLKSTKKEIRLKEVGNPFKEINGSGPKLKFIKQYLKLKYPRPYMTREKIFLQPVEHNSTILNFGEDNKVAERGNKIMTIGNCSAALTTTLCRKMPYST